MSSQVVLGFSIVLILFFGFLFWRLTRPTPGPTELKFRRKMKSIFNLDDGAKQLNAIFVYNAHSFDAYEVLGIPAGSNPEAVERAFKVALAKSTGETQFLQAAYDAILRSRR